MTYALRLPGPHSKVFIVRAETFDGALAVLAERQSEALYATGNAVHSYVALLTVEKGFAQNVNL